MSSASRASSLISHPGGGRTGTTHEQLSSSRARFIFFADVAPDEERAFALEFPGAVTRRSEEAVWTILEGFMPGGDKNKGGGDVQVHQAATHASAFLHQLRKHVKREFEKLDLPCPRVSRYPRSGASTVNTSLVGGPQQGAVPSGRGGTSTKDDLVDHGAGRIRTRTGSGREHQLQHDEDNRFQLHYQQEDYNSTTSRRASSSTASRRNNNYRRDRKVSNSTASSSSYCFYDASRSASVDIKSANPRSRTRASTTSSAGRQRPLLVSSSYQEHQKNGSTSSTRSRRVTSGAAEPERSLSQSSTSGVRHDRRQTTLSRRQTAHASRTRSSSAVPDRGGTRPHTYTYNYQRDPSQSRSPTSFARNAKDRFGGSTLLLEEGSGGGSQSSLTSKVPSSITPVTALTSSVFGGATTTQNTPSMLMKNSNYSTSSSLVNVITSDVVFDEENGLRSQPPVPIIVEGGIVDELTATGGAGTRNNVEVKNNVTDDLRTSVSTPFISHTGALLRPVVAAPGGYDTTSSLNHEVPILREKTSTLSSSSTSRQQQAQELLTPEHQLQVRCTLPPTLLSNFSPERIRREQEVGDKKTSKARSPAFRRTTPGGPARLAATIDSAGSQTRDNNSGKISPFSIMANGFRDLVVGGQAQVEEVFNEEDDRSTTRTSKTTRQVSKPRAPSRTRVLEEDECSSGVGNRGVGVLQRSSAAQPQPASAWNHQQQRATRQPATSSRSRAASAVHQRPIIEVQGAGNSLLQPGGSTAGKSRATVAGLSDNKGLLTLNLKQMLNNNKAVLDQVSATSPSSVDKRSTTAAVDKRNTTTITDSFVPDLRVRSPVLRASRNPERASRVGSPPRLFKSLVVATTTENGRQIGTENAKKDPSLRGGSGGNDNKPGSIYVTKSVSERGTIGARSSKPARLDEARDQQIVAHSTRTAPHLQQSQNCSLPTGVVGNPTLGLDPSSTSSLGNRLSALNEKVNRFIQMQLEADQRLANRSRRDTIDSVVDQEDGLEKDESWRFATAASIDATVSDFLSGTAGGGQGQQEDAAVWQQSMMEQGGEQKSLTSSISNSSPRRTGSAIRKLNSATISASSRGMKPAAAKRNAKSCIVTAGTALVDRSKALSVSVEPGSSWNGYGSSDLSSSQVLFQETQTSRSSREQEQEQEQDLHLQSGIRKAASTSCRDVFVRSSSSGDKLQDEEGLQAVAVDRQIRSRAATSPSMLTMSSRPTRKRSARRQQSQGSASDEQPQFQFRDEAQPSTARAQQISALANGQPFRQQGLSASHVSERSEEVLLETASNQGSTTSSIVEVGEGGRPHDDMIVYDCVIEDLPASADCTLLSSVPFVITDSATAGGRGGGVAGEEFAAGNTATTLLQDNHLRTTSTSSRIKLPATSPDVLVGRSKSLACTSTLTPSNNYRNKNTLQSSSTTRQHAASLIVQQSAFLPPKYKDEKQVPCYDTIRGKLVSKRQDEEMIFDAAHHGPTSPSGATQRSMKKNGYSILSQQFSRNDSHTPKHHVGPLHQNLFQPSSSSSSAVAPASFASAPTHSDSWIQIRPPTAPDEDLVNQGHTLGTTTTSPQALGTAETSPSGAISTHKILQARCALSGGNSVFIDLVFEDAVARSLTSGVVKEALDKAILTQEAEGGGRVEGFEVRVVEVRNLDHILDSPRGEPESSQNVFRVLASLDAVEDDDLPPQRATSSFTATRSSKRHSHVRLAHADRILLESLAEFLGAILFPRSALEEIAGLEDGHAPPGITTTSSGKMYYKDRQGEQALGLSSKSILGESSRTSMEQDRVQLSAHQHQTPSTQQRVFWRELETADSSGAVARALQLQLSRDTQSIARTVTQRLAGLDQEVLKMSTSPEPCNKNINGGDSTITISITAPAPAARSRPTAVHNIHHNIDPRAAVRSRPTVLPDQLLKQAEASFGAGDSPVVTPVVDQHSSGIGSISGGGGQFPILSKQSTDPQGGGTTSTNHLFDGDSVVSSEQALGDDNRLREGKEDVAITTEVDDESPHLFTSPDVIVIRSSGEGSSVVSSSVVSSAMECPRGMISLQESESIVEEFESRVSRIPLEDVMLTSQPRKSSRVQLPKNAVGVDEEETTTAATASGRTEQQQQPRQATPVYTLRDLPNTKSDVIPEAMHKMCANLLAASAPAHHRVSFASPPDVVLDDKVRRSSTVNASRRRGSRGGGGAPGRKSSIASSNNEKVMSSADSTTRRASSATASRKVSIVSGGSTSSRRRKSSLKRRKSEDQPPSTSDKAKTNETSSSADAEVNRGHQEDEQFIPEPEVQLDETKQENEKGHQQDDEIRDALQADAEADEPVTALQQEKDHVVVEEMPKREPLNSLQIIQPPQEVVPLPEALGGQGAVDDIIDKAVEDNSRSPSSSGHSGSGESDSVSSRRSASSRSMPSSSSSRSSQSNKASEKSSQSSSAGSSSRGDKGGDQDKASSSPHSRSPHRSSRSDHSADEAGSSRSQSQHSSRSSSSHSSRSPHSINTSSEGGSSRSASASGKGSSPRSGSGKSSSRSGSPNASSSSRSPNASSRSSRSPPVSRKSSRRSQRRRSNRSGSLQSTHSRKLDEDVIAKMNRSTSAGTARGPGDGRSSTNKHSQAAQELQAEASPQRQGQKQSSSSSWDSLWKQLVAELPAALDPRQRQTQEEADGVPAGLYPAETSGGDAKLYPGGGPKRLPLHDAKASGREIDAHQAFYLSSFLKSDDFGRETYWEHLCVLFGKSLGSNRTVFGYPVLVLVVGCFRRGLEWLLNGKEGHSASKSNPSSTSGGLSGAALLSMQRHLLQKFKAGKVLEKMLTLLLSDDDSRGLALSSVKTEADQDMDASSAKAGLSPRERFDLSYLASLSLRAAIELLVKEPKAGSSSAEQASEKDKVASLTAGTPVVGGMASRKASRISLRNLVRGRPSLTAAAAEREDPLQSGAFVPSISEMILPSSASTSSTRTDTFCLLANRMLWLLELIQGVGTTMSLAGLDGRHEDGVGDHGLQQERSSDEIATAVKRLALLQLRPLACCLHRILRETPEFARVLESPLVVLSAASKRGFASYLEKMRSILQQSNNTAPGHERLVPEDLPFCLAFALGTLVSQKESDPICITLLAETSITTFKILASITGKVKTVVSTEEEQGGTPKVGTPGGGRTRSSSSSIRKSTFTTQVQHQIIGEQAAPRLSSILRRSFRKAVPTAMISLTSMGTSPPEEEDVVLVSAVEGNYSKKGTTSTTSTSSHNVFLHIVFAEHSLPFVFGILQNWTLLSKMAKVGFALADFLAESLSEDEKAALIHAQGAERFLLSFGKSVAGLGQEIIRATFTDDSATVRLQAQRLRVWRMYLGLFKAVSTPKLLRGISRTMATYDVERIAIEQFESASQEPLQTVPGQLMPLDQLQDLENFCGVHQLDM
ncbi:unnamed protein product [Amoebophrya sp. A25]|nr:unnamed protein product [Amoebophrya sp. A25]|eukprot:GSA25T00006913001.1